MTHTITRTWIEMRFEGPRLEEEIEGVISRHPTGQMILHLSQGRVQAIEMRERINDQARVTQADEPPFDATQGQRLAHVRPNGRRHG